MKRPCLVIALMTLALASGWAETAFVAEYVGGNQVISADLTAGTQEVVLPGRGWIMDIAIDPDVGKLYWIESPMDLMRSNLDGSEVEVVMGGFMFAPGSSGLALDLVAGKTYWNDMDRIYRTNLDGTNLEMVNGPWQVTLTGGIDVDVAAGKIYYSGIPQATPIDPIYRSNLNGSAIEVVWDHPTMLVGSLALDNTNHMIYFADTNGSGIHRVDKNGQGLTLIYPSSDVCGVAVDPEANTVYWADYTSRSVWSADLDGANPTRVIYTSPSAPTALVVADLTPPVPPAPPAICGDCSGNQVGPDILDALVAAQVAASFEVAGVQPESCDVNNSGGVEILDALVLAQCAAQLQATLNCP